ncbi:MAG: hypothetical protein AAFQ35_12475 [Pseudomonadota bacterium]
MIYVVLNAVPILLAAAVSWGITAAFEPRARTIWPGAVIFAAFAWMAAITAGALIVAPPQAGEWTMAIMTGVVLAIGFFIPARIIDDRNRAASWVASLLGGVRWLAVLLAQVLVMKTYGLVPPPGL